MRGLNIVESRLLKLFTEKGQMAASIAAHVRALREGDDASKTAAAVALCSLTWSPYIPENRVAIAQAGGIEPLVQLLHDGSAMAKVRGSGFRPLA